jgi:hypothetical protein
MASIHNSGGDGPKALFMTLSAGLLGGCLVDEYSRWKVSGATLAPGRRAIGES